MLRDYIRNVLLTEGMAHFGTNIFMRKIAEKTKQGKCFILSPRSFKDGDAITKPSMEFQWKLIEKAWDEIWLEAKGPFKEWLHKKFFNQAYFTENWSSIAFAFVLKTSNIAGQAWDDTYYADSSGKKLIGRRAPDKERYKWRVSDYWDKKGLNKWDGLDKKNWSHHTNYISFFISKYSFFKEDSQKYGKKPQDMFKEWKKNPNWKKISNYILQDLDSTNATPAQSNVWSHEMQHWVQFLHYRGNKKLANSDYSKIEKLGRVSFYDSKHQDTFSGLKSKKWIAQADELDSEIAAWLGLFSNEILIDPSHIGILIDLLEGNTEKALSAVLAWVNEKAIEREFKSRLRKRSASRIKESVRRFVDYLQECVETANPHNYISHDDFKVIKSQQSSPSSYGIIKDSGYIQKLEKLLRDVDVHLSTIVSSN